MTATATETPLDLSGIEPEDAPEFSVPDSSRSREERRNFFRSTKPAEETTSRRTATKKRKPAPRAKRGAFIEPLTQLYTLIGGMLMPFDPQCANVVIMSAEHCAESMDNLAYENEAVRRALTALTQTSAIGAVVMAHAPIIMAVAMHHGPGGMQAQMMGMFGGNSPEPEPANGE